MAIHLPVKSTISPNRQFNGTTAQNRTQAPPEKTLSRQPVKDSVKFGSHDAERRPVDTHTEKPQEQEQSKSPIQKDDKKEANFFQKLLQGNRWKAAAKVGWAEAADKQAIWSDFKWSSILALLTCWMAGTQLIFIPIIMATGFGYRAVTGAMQGFQHPELAEHLDELKQTGKAETK